MKMTTTYKAGERTQNKNEFPNIEGAMLALEALGDKISEIRDQRELTRDSKTVIGWKNEDNFGEFADAMLDDDKEFLRKLVNLGLCLP